MKRLCLTRIVAAAAVAGLLAGGLSEAARAQEQNLIFATGLPAAMHMSVSVLHPWADRINEQGKGVLHIDMRDGMALATPANSYERVLDDAIQIGWGSQVYIAGKFKRTGVISLPALFDNAEIGSAAFWRLYKSGLLDAEYDEVVPLILIAFADSNVHMAKPYAPLDSFAGLKVIGTSKQLSQAIALLGGSPISLQTTDIYESMLRHAVDGVVTSWAIFPAFKLDEVAFFHVETGMGGAPGMVFMARKKYESLSPAARKIIDANATEQQTRLFGAFSDQEAEAERQILLASPQHTIVTPTPEQQEKIKARLAPMITEWAGATPDGENVLTAFRQHVADVKAGR